MTKRTKDKATACGGADDDYMDLIVAIHDYSIADTKEEKREARKALRSCLAGGRPLPDSIRMTLGDAFVARLLRNGRALEPWQGNPEFARAILSAFTTAMADAQQIRKRDRDSRTNGERAADVVCKLEPFQRMKLTRSSVLRAVTFARKNAP